MCNVSWENIMGRGIHVRFNVGEVSIYAIGDVCGLPGRDVLCVVSELLVDVCEQCVKV